MDAAAGIRVEARSIEKSYGGVRALRGVSVQIERGEIHALVGENGAGKSTLGKIIAGSIRHDGGELIVGGEPRSYREPADAIRDGIAIVDQELALLPSRSVIENVFLGMEFATAGVLRSRAAAERFAELIETTGFALRPTEVVGDLRLADQQKVEILRALARDAELIVMDEPSAALTMREMDQLHVVIRDLKARGTTVVLVTHFMEEVFAVTDRVSILRDGELVRTTRTSEETPESIIFSMLGRELEAPPAALPIPAESPKVLEVRGLTRPGSFEDITFSVRRGEIVGISGLVGAGRTETCRAIFGADRYTAGEVILEGKPVRFATPHDAIEAGLAMLPENRKELGLLMGRSVKENITLPHLARFATGGIIRSRREKDVAKLLVDKVGVKTAGVEAAVSTLSGGNQQKVVLTKWLVEEPKVLIIDEPTRGVDVGAKSAIYRLLRELAAKGMAIIVVSSEMDEVLALSHRVLVMARGRLIAEFPRVEATKEAILAAAFWSPDHDAIEEEIRL